MRKHACLYWVGFFVYMYKINIYRTITIHYNTRKTNMEFRFLQLHFNSSHERGSILVEMERSIKEPLHVEKKSNASQLRLRNFIKVCNKWFLSRKSEQARPGFNKE